MPDKIAVDIVLLPCEKMMQTAIETNRKLETEGKQKILLNSKDAIPHISLLMGCMNESDLPQITEIVKELASRYLPLPLQVSEIVSKTEENGETNTLFNIQKTNTLRHLHEEVFEKINPLLSTGVKKEMMYAPEKVDKRSTQWVDHFADKHSLENYEPHLTIGLGDLETIQIPGPFHSYHLAVCQLGNYCTCGKILFKTSKKA